MAGSSEEFTGIQHQRREKVCLVYEFIQLLKIYVMKDYAIACIITTLLLVDVNLLAVEHSNIRVTGAFLPHL